MRPAAPSPEKSARAGLRHAFLATHGWANADLKSLAPDASFRSYHRLCGETENAMLMDAPPEHESVAAFARVSEHLARLGVRVPGIYAMDAENGFLLLEDLGDKTFTRLLDAGGDQFGLYQSAVDVLARIHTHPGAASADLPCYDLEVALGEANLFLDWYLPAQLQRALDATARREFAQVWAGMLAELPPLPPTLVLRDYHVDNLMRVGRECALLDYQDALIGSPAYDLVSLLEDARRDVPKSLREHLRQRYLRQNPGLDPDALRQHYIFWGAQRHCKVAGIFVRLWLRDGKDAYLTHLPRVLNLLARHINAPCLGALQKWLAEHSVQIEHSPFRAPAAQLLRHCNAHPEA